MDWDEYVRYLLLAGATVLITWFNGWVQITWPSRRRRWVFASRPCWLVRWLCGDLAPGETLWKGGVLVAVLFWWGYTAGVIPPSPLLHGVFAIWGALLAVAMVNSGRKTRLRTRGRCLLSVTATMVVILACREGSMLLGLLNVLPGWRAWWDTILTF